MLSIESFGSTGLGDTSGLTLLNTSSPMYEAIERRSRGGRTPNAARLRASATCNCRSTNDADHMLMERKDEELHKMTLCALTSRPSQWSEHECASEVVGMTATS